MARPQVRYNCSPDITRSLTDHHVDDGGFSAIDRLKPAAPWVRVLDLPPVVPIMTAHLGIQYAPSERVAINLEGGIQTTFFIGVSAAVFFE